MADETHPQGRILASGRASEIVLLDEHRVLRRVHGRGHHALEAALMRHARAHGYPVPEVHEVRPDGLVMERILGGTMWDDLCRNPSRAASHAGTLAELHRRLHRISPPPEAPARYGEPQPGNVLLHGDLHPLNVMLSPLGPVVVDWTNAGRGPGGADVADTWLVLEAAAAFDELLAPGLRRSFEEAFLAAAGRSVAA
ncbi:MAG: phosphotransferase, partial [Candidatus Dormiibacterota bacterium]